jgi:hypothetical protein
MKVTTIILVLFNGIIFRSMHGSVADSDDQHGIYSE